MRKINIIVADNDKAYVKQLTNYLIHSEHPLEVYSFDQQASLVRFLETNMERADILLLSEDMQSVETDRYHACLKVLLAESRHGEIEGYYFVPKYQKTSELVNSIMLRYGKKSGQADTMSRGDRNTQFIAVYSPVGGCGKTTISLLLAYQLAAEQKKVFYQNCEHIDSTRSLLPMNAQISLSDVLVELHKKESGVGLKLISGMSKNSRVGFSYVNPPDSSMEWNEISIQEQKALLDELEKLRQFDAVVLDFDSELNETKLELLQMCDHIIVPFLPDTISLNKLIQFFREMTLRDELSRLSDRMIYVGNRIVPGIDTYLQQSTLYQKCTPTLMLPVSEVMANIATELQSGRLDGSAVQSVIDEIFRKDLNNA